MITEKANTMPSTGEAFDTYIPQAAVTSSVLEALVAPAPETFGIHPAHITRDGFSGAVACREVQV